MKVVFLAYFVFLLHSKRQICHLPSQLLRKCACLSLIKQYLSNLVTFYATFAFSNSRFFEPIFVSLGGSRNQDSTVYRLMPRVQHNGLVDKVFSQIISSFMILFIFQSIKQSNYQTINQSSNQSLFKHGKSSVKLKKVYKIIKKSYLLYKAPFQASKSWPIMLHL